MPVRPDNVATLLHRLEGLSPQKVAFFLLREGNEEYCRAFFAKFDFTCDFLTALRLCFCGKFALPPEGIEFEKAMRAMAEAFVARNPGVFQSPDDAVTLACALVLVNAKLTAPGKKEKIARDEFVSKTLPTITGSSITPDELAGMLDAMIKKPLTFSGNGDFMTACAPILRGWLRKKDRRFGSHAKELFCVLAGACLFYFADNTPASEDKPLGMVQLTDVEVLVDEESALKFALISKVGGLQAVKFKNGPPQIAKGLKKIEFEAKTAELRDKWAGRLAKSVSLSGLMDNDGAMPTLAEA
jgi:hypothetical protein